MIFSPHESTQMLSFYPALKLVLIQEEINLKLPPHEALVKSAHETLLDKKCELSVKMERPLTTRKEISVFVGRPRKTIEKWIREDNFQARILDGRRYSEPSLIVEWMRKQLEKK